MLHTGIGNNPRLEGKLITKFKRSYCTPELHALLGGKHIMRLKEMSVIKNRIQVGTTQWACKEEVRVLVGEHRKYSGLQIKSQIEKVSLDLFIQNLGLYVLDINFEKPIFTLIVLFTC